MRATWVRAVGVLLLIAAPAVGAQDASFWAFLEGRVVTRCAEQSAAHVQAAAERLQRLNDRVERLESSDPVDEVVGGLHDLLRTECFLAAAEIDRVPSPTPRCR
jgi:hypothetical protein